MAVNIVECARSQVSAVIDPKRTLSDGRAKHHEKANKRKQAKHLTKEKHVKQAKLFKSRKG